MGKYFCGHVQPRFEYRKKAQSVTDSIGNTSSQVSNPYIFKFRNESKCNLRLFRHLNIPSIETYMATISCIITTLLFWITDVGVTPLIVDDSYTQVHEYKRFSFGTYGVNREEFRQYSDYRLLFISNSHLYTRFNAQGTQVTKYVGANAYKPEPEVISTMDTMSCCICMMPLIYSTTKHIYIYIVYYMYTI